MKRNILSMTLAASIAITGMSAAPARAENQDFLGALIFGAIALGVLNEHVKNNRKPDRPVAAPQPAPQPKPVHTKPRRKVLPAFCMRRHETNQGRVKLVGNRCLQNNYRHVASLPDRCFSRVTNLAGKKRKGFRPRCLRKRGYSFQ